MDKAKGILKAGFGVNVGVNFARLRVDTPIDVDDKRGGYVFGHIPGDLDSPLGFMRESRVYVSAPVRALKAGETA